MSGSWHEEASFPHGPLSHGYPPIHPCSCVVHSVNALCLVSRQFQTVSPSPSSWTVLCRIRKTWQNNKTTIHFEEQLFQNACGNLHLSKRKITFASKHKTHEEHFFGCVLRRACFLLKAAFLFLAFLAFCFGGATAFRWTTACLTATATKTRTVWPTCRGCITAFSSVASGPLEIHILYPLQNGIFSSPACRHYYSF